MSDPIRDLEDFARKGVDVNPLPPSEVRRRGDRRRRRQYAVVAGAAAAIVAIALPVTLFAGGTDRSAPDPAGPSPSITPDGQSPEPVPEGVRGQIPDDFPLTIGLPATNGDGSPVTVSGSASEGITGLEICGKALFSTKSALDVASASYAGEAEDSRSRTLALFRDAAAADEALDKASAGVASCPSETIGGTEQVYADAQIPIAEQSLVYTHRYRTEGNFDTGLEVVGLVRVGNAVLLLSEYGEGGGSEESMWRHLQSVELQAINLAGEMCLFAADPCAKGSGRQTGTGGDEIPADFPLDLDQATMEGDGGETFAPAEDVEGVRYFQLCDRPVWTVDWQDRIGASATGPEYADRRELRTYASADQAIAQMDAFRAAVADCPTDGTAVHTVQSADTGYDSFSFSVIYDRMASVAVQFTRVGRSVLALTLYGEGLYEEPPQTATTRKLAAEMCLFTQAGC